MKKGKQYYKKVSGIIDWLGFSGANFIFVCPLADETGFRMLLKNCLIIILINTSE